MMQLFFLLISTLIVASNGYNLIVSTTIGTLEGHYNEAGIREWKGIPYAKPPVG